MKSAKARIALCWGLALLSVAAGFVGTALLYALLPGEATALQTYLINIPSEVFCFALPALLILCARPQRLERFGQDLKKINVNITGCCALGAVAATVIVSLIAMLWGSVLQTGFGYTEPAQANILPQNAGQWLLTLLATAVVPALAEELFFRGMLQGMLTRHLPRLGVWLAALCFAAAHLSWGALPALFLMGLMLGYVYRNHGYWASALFHGLYNAAVLVLSRYSVSIALPQILLCALALACALRGLKTEGKSHETDRSGL